MKSLAKMSLLLSLLFLLSACASHQVFEPTSWAKTNFEEAHTDCMVKMKVALPANEFQFRRPKERFMNECMAGQGWKVAR